MKVPTLNVDVVGEKNNLNGENITNDKMFPK